MKKISLPNNLDTEKILFVVTTEFGLLMAILHYLENMLQLGQAVFILLKTRDTRFNNINFDHLPGKYYLFKNNMTEAVIFPDRKFEQVLHLDNVTHIVFQNPNDLLNQVIVQRYLKENNNISLTVINDGLTKSIDMKGWIKLKLIFKMLFRKYFNGYRLLSPKKYMLEDVRSYCNTFIANENIGIEHFINSNTLLLNIPKYDKLLSTIYNFNYEFHNYENKTMIFFTQPIRVGAYFSDNEVKLYLKTLSALADLAKTKKISLVLKIHPSENPDRYSKFINDFVTIDENSNVPAELILNTVKGSIIISMFSSISLYENKQNRHFWLYKLMNFKRQIIKARKSISIPDDFEMFTKQLL